MKALTCFAFALLLFVPVLTNGQDATQPPKPAEAKKPTIYDEKADAKALINTGLALAKRENRRVLIQWGGNWCGWCVLLHDRFKKDPGLAKTLLYEYALVHIDSNNNMELAAKYGADLKKDGVPYLTVLDAEGKVLINQSTVPFETKDGDKNGHDPKKLQEFLTANQATPLKAEDELAAALAAAAKSERKVFLHYGAPWCGWCVKLENWLARPEIAAVFGKDFVDVKIDIDRMAGGKEIHSRYRKDEKGGIPWMAMLDAQGKVLITSDGPKGNIGYPATIEEIAHFVAMLKNCKQRLTDQEIDGLRASLVSLIPGKAAGTPGQ
jgi:thiol-disulfide isomerase/thioredoxin